MTLHCIVCREPVPDDKARRGKHFCANPDCYKAYRKWRRSRAWLDRCRLCGRAGAKSKQAEALRGVQQATGATAG